MLEKSAYFYELPPKLIAQRPAERRDGSRLLAVDRKTGLLRHLHFYDLPSLLTPGDCLILNDTRVLPARLYGKRADNGAKVEFLLLRQMAAEHGSVVWETLCGPGKKAGVGKRFDFSGKMTGEIVEWIDGGNRLVRFFADSAAFYGIIEQIGEIPLPHYITEKPEDTGRYQTVYANEPGSAAAPTAGLHFTAELLSTLEEKGVKVGKVTLHVGLGTFRPVKEDNITRHKMHTEHFTLPPETAALINRTKQDGGRVICVGTTACRTVESVAQSGEIKEKTGETDIFIYPGYTFKCMDGLITNFHLPESTLIMLVSAFLGYENTMEAYKTAVRERYRFFSFGDAMAIL
ncbi:MAG: tRNA preQ1(34) S-adenosylmethionine ribosyltransferase-isomerase QueA [Oscillospiraceae bacterium]|nr:tRNA preQ1(34) S-adenosylmethionine ribosyltransferase-isomerase QueA [Oscillospiraceae bacterium]